MIVLQSRDPAALHPLQLEVFEHRRESYRLSEERADVQALFIKILADLAPTSTARPDIVGPEFDATMWARLCGHGFTALGLPEEVGGDGADLVDVALLAESLGRHLIPAPFVATIVASRALAAVATQQTGAGATVARGVCDRVFAGAEVLALQVERRPVGRAPGSPSVVRCLVGEPGRLLLTGPTEADPAVVLLEGPAADVVSERARAEERVLTAASLVGAASWASELAVEFAQQRRTRGVPIGSLQAISHPLATCAVEQASARNLFLRAAWYLDHEPSAHRELVPAALVYAGDTARHTVEVALHTHGGAGVCLESEVSRCFTWVQGTVLAAVRRADLIAEVGDWLAADSAHH